MEAKVVVLGSQHKASKKNFKCGNDILDKYLPILPFKTNKKN